jgi:hypothetical protein
VIEVLIKAGDTRITLDADGAARLGATTSCDVEFVRQETGALALFRIRTTRAQPELARCVDAVRAVPGIAFVQENVTVKSVR